MSGGYCGYFEKRVVSYAIKHIEDHLNKIKDQSFEHIDKNGLIDHLNGWLNIMKSRLDFIVNDKSESNHAHQNCADIKNCASIQLIDKLLR